VLVLATGTWGFYVDPHEQLRELEQWMEQSVTGKVSNSKLSEFFEGKTFRRPMVRIQGARAVAVDYPLLRRDFPCLRSRSDPEVDRWLLENAAYVRLRHAQLAPALGIHPPITLERCESCNREGIVPPLYGRGAIMSTYASGCPGFLDVKGIGTDNPSLNSHKDGVLTLGEALGEYYQEKLASLVLTDSARRQWLRGEEPRNMSTVGTYAVLGWGDGMECAPPVSPDIQTRHDDEVHDSECAIFVRQGSRRILAGYRGISTYFLPRELHEEVEQLFNRYSMTMGVDVDTLKRIIDFKVGPHAAAPEEADLKHLQQYVYTDIQSTVDVSLVDFQTLTLIPKYRHSMPVVPITYLYDCNGDVACCEETSKEKFFMQGRRDRSLSLTGLGFRNGRYAVEFAGVLPQSDQNFTAPFAERRSMVQAVTATLDAHFLPTSRYSSSVHLDTFGLEETIPVSDADRVASRYGVQIYSLGLAGKDGSDRSDVAKGTVPESSEALHRKVHISSWYKNDMAAANAASVGEAKPTIDARSIPEAELASEAEPIVKVAPMTPIEYQAPLGNSLNFDSFQLEDGHPNFDYSRRGEEKNRFLTTSGGSYARHGAGDGNAV